ncbi:MarR family winged helix-turn-helix transcriptional regulator [Oryzobacter telluris]|uniref:MarR family winged helix-turn-helix transcriptional regulator n=1 Tax=Oryzobacter telluris TaxID=3149179 RepID=UPI00370DD924
MSRDLGQPDFKPLIALAWRADRALQADMVAQAHRAGHPGIKPAHNAVFATLQPGGTRAADMAARYGMTRQSMGELLRDMEALGYVEMVPDPDDRRAKLVRYTPAGREVAAGGYRHIRESEERFAREVGVEDFATMRRVLTRVYELLEAEHGRS